MTLDQVREALAAACAGVVAAERDGDVDRANMWRVIRDRREQELVKAEAEL